MTEVSHEPVPKDIVKTTLETSVNEEGTTTVNTNSVEEIMNYNENFGAILSDMKINVPTILTEKVVGIRMESTEEPEAPQKFYVVFETEKPSELSQISVIDRKSVV